MYVPLDVNFPDDDKVMEVGLEGAGLYALALCVAKRLLSDGVLSRAQLRRLGGDDALVERMVRVGLFEPHAENAVRICAWLSHNQPASEVLTSDKGSLMAHRRWHVGRNVVKPDCPHCSVEEPQVNADACPPHAEAYAQAPPPHMPEGEIEPEVEPEPEQDPHTAASPTLIAKLACRQIADRNIKTRIANGEEIHHPEGLAKKHAAEDLWPALGEHLIALANEHPDWSPDHLAEYRPSTEAEPSVAALMRIQDEKRLAAKALEPAFDEAAAIAPEGLAKVWAAVGAGATSAEEGANG